MTNRMRREDFMAKYGNEIVVFDRYYKFKFTYKGKMSDDHTIVVDYGGVSDDIYRHEVVAGVMESVNSIYPDSGYIYSPSGELVYEFHD